MFAINGFSDVLTELHDFGEILRDLQNGVSPLLATGLSPIHKAHFIYAAVEKSDRRALAIAPDEPSATKLCEDINRFFGCDTAIMYPEREFFFRDTEGLSREYEFERLKVLASLMNGDEPKIVVASAQAALQRTVPPEMLQSHSFTVHVGDEMNPAVLLKKLAAAGYERREQVDGVCQFSQRGGIVDFHTPHLPDPFRIEFWGDVVDSIATFKLDTQRREDNCKFCNVTPAKEVLFGDAESFSQELERRAAALKGKATAPAKERILSDILRLNEGLELLNVDKYLPIIYSEKATLLDYMSGSFIFLSDPTGVRESLKNYGWHMHEDIKVLFEEGILFEGCDLYCLDYEHLLDFCHGQSTLIMDTFTRNFGELPLQGLFNINAVQLAVWGGEIAHLTEDLGAYTESGYTVCIMAGTPKAAAALTDDLLGLKYRVSHSQKMGARIPGQVYVLDGGLSAGFEYPDIKLAVISHGRSVSTKHSKRRGSKSADPIKSLADLQSGDYVVHVSHGIGIFEGIIKREIHDVVKDYIKIRYAGTDALFVPVTQLDLVSKYIGAREDGGLKLNKLNSAEWGKTKQRVKAAVADMAVELINLYSQRMQAKGYQFDEDNEWQREFEARFPYEETDDQLRCIEEIKEDMQTSRPMDRLLCGDVGFGKTEVAIRAAFKCVMNSKQCAVLVPTTILAWQHYQTFRQRMEGYPIRIELLSRFRTAKQQEEIVKDIRKGLVDIIIGTHRIIQKDIIFKDLGLAVVDEEQRFGVAHKERFKEMLSSVDVLNLSATPIPRTLNMAMSGIRDMSVIEEAPQDRHPVQTYVLEHDWNVLAGAMQRELRRGGQVFYLHNRVESIDSCAFKISQYLPEARIVTAHGKMGEEQLSGVWKKLVEHEIDILVCTTIIETGVDVANCNTLIIEDADRMGLSQLYQIRGRVGRSARRAYAYFTFTRGKQLTEIATKRLSAIKEFTSFGSGFRIAMRDLEIRGAGNVLGAQQHGHMEAVGYDMYLKLLSEAISEQKGESSAKTSVECTVDINIGAHIPESYIESLSQRIDVYKKIAAIQNAEDALDITDELIDRFGEPPEAVQGLVDVALVRGRAAALGIREIKQRDQGIMLYPEKLDMELASKLAGKLRGRVMVNAGLKPYMLVKSAGNSPTKVIAEALTAMES